ncbi:hypothetical protein [Chitinibacter sp. S2-10]|uniref:hypothetical protein n=1 Tax=Chitinibacter sp. S2-10 TaxID=3373597 RepID=UPI0039773F5F
MRQTNVQLKITEQLPEKIDYYMVCASYENRCLSAYENITPDRIENLGVFYFDQFEEGSRANITLYTEKYSSQLFKLDASHPTTIADSIIDFFSPIKTLKSPPNLVIDTSTFTRESLLIALKYLEINKSIFNEIFIFYRAAKVSSSLSDAVLQVRSVLGYMGDIESNKPLHLILLSGFEHERAKEIIDTLEPDFISIGYGAKGQSISDELQAMNAAFTEKLVAYYSQDKINVFEHSLLDPYKAKNEIISIINSKADYNTVIAPLNNKLSTIGAGLAAISNPNVQICYAQMGSYNESAYSEPMDDCYIYPLKFD